MTNNDETNMKPAGKHSLFKYDEGTSYTSRSGPVEATEGASTSKTESEAPVQFGSRRERRMSETGIMRQVPPAPVPASKDVEKKTPVPQMAPVLSLTQANNQSKFLPPARPRFKNYWGGTAMMVALLTFIVAQAIAMIALIGHIYLHKDLQDSLFTDPAHASEKLTAIMMATPWLLLLSSGLMYSAWLGSMWWVTRYRSGVQMGKKFWNAFKDNFRLNNFKWRDIAYGAGIAAVMLGLQVLLNVLAANYPEIKAEVDKAGNTDSFKDMSGITFYLFAFGMGSIIGPIFEELFFRGFLLRGFENHFSYKNSGRNMDMLEDELAAHATGLSGMMVAYRSFTHKYRYVLATIAVTVLFGLAHYQGSWITCLMTGLLGLVFAIVTLKTNRLYPSIFAHILHNGTIMAFILLTK